ncbi:HK97 gp10 family phage protein [Xanthobacteraceae bacterium A53D]
MASIRGRDRLLKKLKQLPVVARSEIKQALAQSADELVAKQKALASSKRVADSIEQSWGDKPASGPTGMLVSGGPVAGDPDLTVWITAGSWEAYWARWEEFGTAPHKQGGFMRGTMHPGTRARPFFFPPFRMMKKKMRSRISRASTRAAKKVAGGS